MIPGSFYVAKRKDMSVASSRIDAFYFVVLQAKIPHNINEKTIKLDYVETFRFFHPSRNDTQHLMENINSKF